MIDEYLNSLDEEEKEKTAAQSRFGAASIQELAKLAGIKLAEDVCANCGGKMEKTGSILKCGCGMMKKAGKGKQYAQDLQKLKKPGMSMGDAVKAYNKKYKKKTAMDKEALLPGALAGYLAQGDPKSTPRSGFWRGMGGGIAGGVLGAAPGIALQHPGLAMAGSLAGQIGGGILGGRTAKATPEELAAYKAKTSSEKTAIPMGVARALVGGGVGGAMGAGLGAAGAGPENRGRGALAGGLLGAGAGALGHSLLYKMPQTKRMVASLQKSQGARTLGEQLSHLEQAGKASRLPAAVQTAGIAGTGVGAYQAGKAMQDKTASDELAEKLVELIELHGGDLEKTAAVLEEHGMSKEAFLSTLKALGTTAKGAVQVGRQEGLKAGLGAAGRGLQWTGHQAAQSAKALPGKVSAFGQKIKGQFGEGAGQWGAAGRSGGRVWEPGLRGRETRDIMGGLANVAKQNPALVAGTAGAAGLGAGALMAKRGSAIFEVGDAAGRLFAKTAQEPSLTSAPIPIDEIRESIEEAQAREDIPGRARRWQIGGGIGGGLLGGGAGYGAGRLIGPKAGLVGAGLGAAGGAFGGQRMGKEYGAEEARADKAVSMLRALRAHQAGAMSGYGAGMQRGYTLGRGGPQGE